MENINVVVCNVGEKPLYKSVPNDLETFQSIVGGYIEIVRLKGSLLMVVNEEGKLKDLDINLHLPYDTIVGNVVFVNSNGEGDFTSITESDNELIQDFIETYSRMERH